MKNKLLVGVLVSLIIMTISVRVAFNKKFEKFQISISNFESTQNQNYIKEKDNFISQLSVGDKSILQQFNEQYDESKAIINSDTTFRFFYISKKINYKKASTGYLKCLNEKCILDIKNKTVQSKYIGKEKEFKSKYKSTFDFWEKLLNEKKLTLRIKRLEECSNFFPEYYELIYDDKFWKDFEKLLTTYNSEIRKSQINNQKAENQYNSNLSTTRRSLNENVKDYFDSMIENKKSRILQTVSESKTFNSTFLGLVTYEVNNTIYDKQTFNEIAELAFEEQWKTNSLRTGAMPYANCYGTNNYCSDWGCSQIQVLTGGSSDVLVTIKNTNGIVVRHAYINGGNSFTFNVPDGSYQVFFYTGSGWNPNKKMPSSSCSSLRGGFVSNEDVSKDNYINLNNQVMTYELILQESGNFNTKPSSPTEAF